MTLSSPRQIAALFWTTLVLLAGLRFIAFDIDATLAEKTAKVGESRQTLTALRTVLSSLQDAETAQRGFLLSGDAEYLEPYERARIALPVELRQVDVLTASDPAQGTLLPELRSLIEHRLTSLAEGIEVRRTRGLGASVERVKSRQGKRAMDRVRELITELESLEERELGIASEQHRAFYRRSLISFSALTAIDLAVLALGFFILLRYARRRAEAEAEIKRTAQQLREAQASLLRANEQLEHRVQQRTQELAAANELLHVENRRSRQYAEELLAEERKLREVTAQAALTEERERQRIARGLHDYIGQTLAVAKMRLGAARELAQESSSAAASDEFARGLSETRDLLDDAIRHTRSLTFELGSRELWQLGLGAALEGLVERARQQHGIDARFEDDGVDKPLDDDVAVTLFQGARELLHNVLKHARARRVRVGFEAVDGDLTNGVGATSVAERNDAIFAEVSVVDDGSGFDPAQLTAGSATGFGLFSLRERLEYVGGTLLIESTLGAGTSVAMRAPLKLRPTTADAAPNTTLTEVERAERPSGNGDASLESPGRAT